MELTPIRILVPQAMTPKKPDRYVCIVKDFEEYLET